MGFQLVGGSASGVQPGMAFRDDGIPADGMALVSRKDSPRFTADTVSFKSAGAVDSALIAYGGGYSERDVEALVRAVAAEARGESPNVWRGVAGTIVNYARRYGKDIPALTRSSYLSSNYDGNAVFYSMPLGNIPNYRGIRQAVLDALNGAGGVGRSTHFFDNSIGPPYFVSPATCIPKGRMNFCEGR